MNPIQLIKNSRQVQSRILPGFVRLPRAGQRCPYTGLSRTTLFELTVPCTRNGYRPPVAGYQLRSKGAQRGIRLIRLADLYKYIEHHLVKNESPEELKLDRQ